MNNYPPSQYPGQNFPPQQGYPQAPQGYPQNYPQPGAFSPQNNPPPRKSRAGLWIFLIILLFLLVGGASGAYYYFQIRSTPAKTLQAYCTALQNDDAQGIYNTLSTQGQEQISVSKIQDGLRLVSLVTGGIKSCTVDSSSIQESGSSATGQVTLEVGLGRSSNSTVHLVDESNQWKIAATPGVSQ